MIGQPIGRPSAFVVEIRIDQAIVIDGRPVGHHSSHASLESTGGVSG